MKMKMKMKRVHLETVAVVMAMMMVTLGRGAQVVSGKTKCSSDRHRPCYKIAYFHDVSSRVAFREARQACEVDGGSLLSIQDSEEQTAIEDLLQELRSGASGDVGAAGGGGIADSDFWIGLTRTLDPELSSNSFTSCPEMYQWTDGSPAPFRNWYFDEPSCGGEACVVMYHQPTALPGLGGAYLYRWNDDRCNMKHNFICKYAPEHHVVKDKQETPGGNGTVSTGSEEVPPLVTSAGASGMLLVYVILPTIPLLLLILVASGNCCFQMLSRSSPHSKSSSSTLWISTNTKSDRMDV